MEDMTVGGQVARIMVAVLGLAETVATDIGVTLQNRPATEMVELAKTQYGALVKPQVLLENGFFERAEMALRLAAKSSAIADRAAQEEVDWLLASFDRSIRRAVDAAERAERLVAEV